MPVVGLPNTFFIVMTIFELALPFVIVFLNTRRIRYVTCILTSCRNPPGLPPLVLVTVPFEEKGFTSLARR